MNGIPVWVSQYIGKQFEDKGRGPDRFDCYGLVHAVMAEHFGLSLPSYTEDYQSADEAEEIENLVLRETCEWDDAPHGRPGDIVLFRVRGHVWHCGVVVAPGRMLHISKGANATMERYESARWKRRLVAIKRHRSLR